MPVSKNKRKNGKVAKRTVNSQVLDARMRGVEKILKLVSRATQGKVEATKELVFRTTVAKGL